MLKYTLFITAFFYTYSIFGQQRITIKFYDSSTQETLIGVNAFIQSLDKGKTSDINGEITFQLPGGNHIIECSYIGYETYTLTTDISKATTYKVFLIPSSSELEEIVIVSNRANRSVTNTPSRIEVITDEVEEAATMDPSKIAHLLMHTTGVQVQQQSATSGTASVRIQGLYGRYTQILKDGFPIYGGFTGGLGVLQIPPLDLRQVEFVKGSASTLYGGGAIGGLINLISKIPKEKPEASLHINASHIGNLDLNSFYSQKKGKWGLTIFTSNNTNTAYDVDEDGFSDVPEVRKFNFNPRVFYYLDDNTTISLGGTFTNENRIGGEVDIIDGGVVDNENDYFERNKSQQISSLFQLTYKLNENKSIEVKNSTNHFDRNIYLNNYSFSGDQFSTFSEINYQHNMPQGDLTLGANLYTESFTEENLLASVLRNQDLTTFGVFGQYIHDFSSKVSTEVGLRTDYNTDYGTFVLPKVGIVYKPSLYLTARIGGGLGYKLPAIFTEDAEALAFENVLPINDNIQEAEKSIGLNGDFTFRLISTENISISLTEYFFYNRLNSPLLLEENGIGSFEFVNSDGDFETKGIESLIKASAGDFHLYLGYTYVDATQTQDGIATVLPLTPEHSFHGDLMYVVDGKWRCGIDAEYESEQTLRSGRTVRSLFKAGFLAERMFENFSIYVNLENWTDTRQSKYESLVISPATNPRFTEVWAPLDGFIFNAGLKVKL